MSSDYPEGEEPTLEELIAKVEAKGIDLKAEVERAVTKRIETLRHDVVQPKPFSRGDGPMTPEPPAMPKSKIKARKKKRRLQRQNRRKNR